MIDVWKCTNWKEKKKKQTEAVHLCSIDGLTVYRSVSSDQCDSIELIDYAFAAPIAVARRKRPRYYEHFYGSRFDDIDNYKPHGTIALLFTLQFTHLNATLYSIRVEMKLFIFEVNH